MILLALQGGAQLNSIKQFCAGELCGRDQNHDQQTVTIEHINQNQSNCVTTKNVSSPESLLAVLRHTAKKNSIFCFFVAVSVSGKQKLLHITRPQSQIIMLQSYDLYSIPFPRQFPFIFYNLFLFLSLNFQFKK